MVASTCRVGGHFEEIFGLERRAGLTRYHLKISKREMRNSPQLYYPSTFSIIFPTQLKVAPIRVFHQGLYPSVLNYQRHMPVRWKSLWC